MPEPILVFRYVDRRKHTPFKVQGARTSMVHATALHEDKYGGHVFRLPLSKQKEIGEELAKATHQPLSNFYVCDVEGLGDIQAEKDSLLALCEAAQKAAEAGLVALGAANAEIAALKAELANRPVMPDVDTLSFREAYALAKMLGVKGHAKAGKSGNPEPVRALLREHLSTHEKASTTPNGGGDTASAESAADAAA